MIIVILIFLLFFAIGSIPTGLVVGKLYGCDLRETGSKNIGATNALRTLGKKAGLLTFLGDVVKGLVPVLLLILFSSDQTVTDLIPIFGLTTIIGHCYSPFLKFNGGKGVATSTGVFLALIPLYTLMAVVIFLGVVKKSGYVSLGSICSLTFAALITLATKDNYSTELLISISAAAMLVIIRHKKNIVRLLNGEELPYKTNPKQ